MAENRKIDKKTKKETGRVPAEAEAPEIAFFQKLKEFEPRMGKERKMTEDATKKSQVKEELTRDEVIGYLKAWPKGFDDELAKLLNIPDKLYRCPGPDFELGTERDKKNSNDIFNAFRTNNPPLLDKISSYSLGFKGDKDHTYFFLADPQRKIFIFEHISSIFDEDIATWNPVRRALENSIKK